MQFTNDLNGIVKDLYLALVRSVNYREEFETNEEITAFIDFVKHHGGVSAFKISTDFLGKRTHSAVAICIKYFDQVLQKRLIKTVRLLKNVLHIQFGFNYVISFLACEDQNHESV